jgi:hypothetical protein
MSLMFFGKIKYLQTVYSGIASLLSPRPWLLTSASPVNSQILGDNKVAIPSYPVNKYIILTILWYWLSCDIGYPVILAILWYWLSCDIGYSVILAILWYWLSCDIGYSVILAILWYWLSCDIGYPVILAILWYWLSCDIGYPVFTLWSLHF